MSSVARRLLEDYLLHAVGALPQRREERAALRTQMLFGVSPERWADEVREQFGLSVAVTELIQELHQAARAECERVGGDLDPDAFARAVVDENFVELLEIMETELAARDMD